MSRFTVPLALSLLLLCVATGPLWAFRTPIEGEEFPSFPENVYVRRAMYTHLQEPVPDALAAGDEVMEEPGENRQVKFVVERGSPWNDWGILSGTDPAVPTESEAGSEAESEAEDDAAPEGAAPAASASREGGRGKNVLRYIFHFGERMQFTTPTAGTYIVERDFRTGALTRIVIYLKGARGYTAVVRPHPEETEDSLMDLYLCGRRLQEGVRVPLPLDRLLRVSFEELMRITAGYVNWDFYLHRPEFPGMSRLGDVVNQIRPYLSSLKEAEDGAMDSRGRYVHIEDGSLQEGKGGLNCSGFAKWIVDGFYYTRTEQLLPVEPLKQKHPDVRGNRWSEKYEELKDPFFGLDWSRNLAVKMMEVKWGEDFPIESADVDRLTYHLYKEDVGFPVEELRTILYELAVKYPDSFYLGSVNTLIHDEGQLRQHFHVAVFFPWFDADGVLQTAVLERTRETAISDFIEENRGNYIHLVRIEIPGAFSPPGEELDPSLNR